MTGAQSVHCPPPLVTTHLVKQTTLADKHITGYFIDIYWSEIPLDTGKLAGGYEC